MLLITSLEAVDGITAKMIAFSWLKYLVINSSFLPTRCGKNHHTTVADIRYVILCTRLDNLMHMGLSVRFSCRTKNQIYITTTTKVKQQLIHCPTTFSHEHTQQQIRRKRLMHKR